MVAFCKDCRWIYTRPVEELREMAVKNLRETGNAQTPYWGCGHPSGDYLQDEYGFTSCEAMRMHGRPCQPEGVLFEPAPEAA